MIDPRLGPVDVHPVGVFKDLSRIVHTPDRSEAFRVARRAARTLFQRARRGDWGAVKTYFDGYLAEPHEWPPGLTRSGSGWTPERAYGDLSRRARRADQHKDDR